MKNITWKGKLTLCKDTDLEVQEKKYFCRCCGDTATPHPHIFGYYLHIADGEQIGGSGIIHEALYPYRLTCEGKEFTVQLTVPDD